MKIHLFFSCFQKKTPTKNSSKKLKIIIKIFFKNHVIHRETPKLYTHLQIFSCLH